MVEERETEVRWLKMWSRGVCMYSHGRLELVAPRNDAAAGWAEAVKLSVNDWPGDLGRPTGCRKGLAWIFDCR